MVVEGAKAEQPPKTAVEMNPGEKPVTQPWIKRPKIYGSLAPAKRGLVKMLIFDSLFHSVAPMFGSEHNPVSYEAPIPGQAGGYLEVVTAPNPKAEKSN